MPRQGRAAGPLTRRPPLRWPDRPQPTLTVFVAALRGSSCALPAKRAVMRSVRGGAPDAASTHLVGELRRVLAAGVERDGAGGDRPGSALEAVFQTINGDSNVAFWKQFKDSGLDAKKLPVISVSTAEDEVKGVGIDNIVGQYVAWNCYQTTPGAKNEAFVKAFKAKYGADRVTDDPIEAGYVGVHLWAMAAEKAGIDRSGEGQGRVEGPRVRGARSTVRTST